MKNILYTTLFVLALFTAGAFDANAKRVSGYIITIENDTLQGYLNIYNSALRMWTISFTPRMFNAEMAFVEAPFKEEKRGFYKNYTPDQLKEYGFVYKGVPYKFKSFIVKSKTFILNERKKRHFLLLVNKENGREIYKHQKHRYDDVYNQLIPYYEFYVVDKDGELVKVEY
ncbi:hypothetical protein [Plebeiibacterium sediminum]|uniref:Uncharacterized protein n=1 Tax=Plebeiibacterium sediminum TaxID=2992112 RepID=A0AAE3M8S2_9BACT|nr:hypothetical protein [Plebeiobacterium sediminum]MCW3789329.1 hypothetical protein [Plebeiobacterium sediminum]